MAPVPRLPPALLAAACGTLLAACGLPLAWSFLAPLPLAFLLAHVAAAGTPRQVSGRMWWAATAYSAVHLWWLTAFLGKLFGTPALGVLASLLFALEGAFFAAMAFLVARAFRSPAARVWGLAGGWVLLEWLRFLGPLAFPWPTLGYTLLPTPALQLADLGGVLLGSVLVAATAASLVSLRWDSHRPHALLTFAWLAALGYGVTRVPGQGPVQPMLALRTEVDLFNRQSAGEGLLQSSQRLTGAARRPEEVVVWSESVLPDPAFLPTAPANGLYGVSSEGLPRQNRVVAWTGSTITAQTDKARPVPFGEYYPLRGTLAPAWELIERSIGQRLTNLPPAGTLTPLTLGGVSYGAYICYDSVFPRVARTLVAQGAQVLVNPSNDGWYQGWGVQQHFNMGRVRAIETRRWLVRSVNAGVAGAVDDLGRPVQTLAQGEGALHVRPRLLNGQTLYMRLGDLPALLLAGVLLLYARRVDRRR